MRRLYFMVLATIIITACQSNQNQSNGQTEQSNFHKVSVQEVLQTNNYTYLHVKENDSIVWLALPLMEAKAGEVYYYENPMRMSNFQSKELNRTFDVVYFLSGVSKEPTSIKTQNQVTPQLPNDTSGATTEESKRSLSESHTSQTTQQKDIKVEPVAGGVSIKQLYEKKDSYAGKTVKVKGQVTKVNPGIMKRNWIHIQDGTSLGDKFDLTVTTETETKIGEIITFEGKISLNKDFGYGYFYDLIMEDAVQK